MGKRMQSLNKQAKKKPCSASMIRLISKCIYLCGDYIGILLAEWIAFHIRNYLMGNIFQVSAVYIYVVTPAVFLLALAFAGIYSKHYTSAQMLEKLFKACLGGIAFSIILMFLTQVSGQVSRLYVGLFAVIVYLFLVVEKYITALCIRKMPGLQIPVLVVGAGKTADAAIDEGKNNVFINYRVAGFLEDFEPSSRYADVYPILGGFNDLEKVIAETGIQDVIIAAPGLPQDQLNHLLYRAQTLVPYVSVVPNLVGVPMSNAELESFFDTHIMVLNIKNNLAFQTNQIIKRIFDIVCTVCGGILISPLLLAVFVWVKLDSPGPAFFQHRRVGKDGKEFNCYKFRSMVVDSKERLEKLLATDPKAKEEWERDFKLKNDPRITKSGAFLRKTSLDELPQLLNVLKGEMSLVGPRPIVQKEVPKYGQYIKEYYMVLPGITGLWQASGRSDIDYPERVAMDRWYVHNWSVWLDIILIWRTLFAVIHSRGAY